MHLAEMQAEICEWSVLAKHALAVVITSLLWDFKKLLLKQTNKQNSSAPINPICVDHFNVKILK